VFGVQVKYPVGTSPVGITAGEFSATPGIDLATADEGNTVTILSNQGDGSFVRSGRVDVDARFTATAIVSGRFNDDMIDDFAISADDSESFPDFNGAVVIYRSTATFRYSPAPVTVGILPTCVTSGDLTGDDIPDLVSCGSEADAGLVSLLKGNLDGTFAGALGIPLANIIPSRLVVADLDHDAPERPDLIVLDPSNNAVWILYGRGPGPIFDPPVKLAQIDDPSAAVVAVFGHDTLPGIAVANRFNGQVVIFRQQSPRTFAAPVAYQLGLFPVDLVAANFDHDQSGTLDLVSANNGSSDATLLLGNEDGTFRHGETVAVGIGPVAVVAADFNGDSMPDFATANQDDETFGGNTQSVSVVLNGITRFDPNCDGVLDEADLSTVTARIFDGTSGCLTRPVTAADLTLTVQKVAAQ
jgi:hypothetical protein